MTKRVRITLLVLVLVIAGFTAWELWRGSKIPDPVCQGRRLSQWLDDIDPHTQKLSPSAALAIQQLGTNAVPRLLIEASSDSFHPGDILIELLRRQRWLRVHSQTGSDHQARALRGFSALGETGARGLAQGLTNSNWVVRHGCIGQWEFAKDYPAICLEPLLDRLRDPEPKVRARAANAIGMIRQQPEKAVPALIGLLQDPDDWVRSMAALGLSCYREQAKSAVPALLQTLTNCSSGFRFFGTNALKAIEPSALTNVGSI
jgi:hypothetical protein